MNAEVVAVAHLSLVKITGLIVGTLVFCACSGTPKTDHGRDAAVGGQGAGGSSATGLEANAGQSQSSKALFGTAGARSIEISTEAPICTTTCQPGQCGPITNECGNVVECGGCVPPEICGGAGIPSRCGSPLVSCVPKTCESISATCGMQSDGCGGILDCWSSAAKASGVPACEIAGFVCVDGTCRSTAPECKRLTCNDYAGATGLCGPVSDGCGGTLDCGLTCKADETCGVIEPGKCGKIVCTPLTCEAALERLPPGYCGIVPDGCGGVIEDCSMGCAVDGESCGGGGEPDVCGKGAPDCTPRTVDACGITCGVISDGCGGIVQCTTCTLPDTCGGGGVPSQCGVITCKPRTCASLGATCGQILDGCGNTLDCGTCTAPETCGGAGKPNQCGSAVCVPKTPAQVCLPGRCGQQSDGCGATVDCGGCTLPNTCGGGGTPSVCGAPTCTKRTCADAGANCGPIADGCGGVILSCGTCTGTDLCGAVYPSVCGAGIDPNCKGLCKKIDHTCTTGQETRLTGKVYAPNGTDPIYNAVVYVPNTTLPTIPSGPSCDRCQDEDLGQPIAAAISAPDGTFELRNVPAGVDFPLVVKIGKWRRVVTIPAVPRCTSRALVADQTRLPKSMTDATPENVGYLNIPHFAVVSGSIDAMECVVREMGVVDSEFTHPTGGGRIHIYYGNGGYLGTTTTTPGGTRADLFAKKTDGKYRIYDYDIAVFDCEASPYEYKDFDPILLAWANAGGRVFASHYAYAYLHDNGDFANSAVWGGSGGYESTGAVDLTTERGQAFNTWLGATGSWHPTYGSGFVFDTAGDGYVQDVRPGSDRVVFTDPLVLSPTGATIFNYSKSIVQYGFNTPFGADADHICGRVAYSAFHVSASGSGQFPSYCLAGAMTTREKILMFALFDLASCVTVGGPDTPKTCTPRTCEQQNANCGRVADGCGGLLNCGSCTAPYTCGGGGVANQCGNSCTRTTCGAQGANCGIVADGCGGTLDCGTCTQPAVCGGGGTPNVCGQPACIPRTCADVGATCGAISDGCGGTVNCGTCVAPATCGGGGVPNVCGIGSCVPVTCGSATCGFVGDGCGGTVACGTCTDDQACVNGVCVGGACKPRACTAANATCGYIGDGCGGLVNCGVCESPLVCGGGGIPSQCGGSCTPRSCEAANAQCGAISDGCGGIKQCGTCPPGQSCGGGGVPNHCAAGTCTPRTCAAADADCGEVGDGCGGVLDCGQCVLPLTCGGAGVPNKCGSGGCVPLTCQQQNANCGPVADGCGGLLDCGTCSHGQTCGGDGIPSRCGGSILY